MKTAVSSEKDLKQAVLDIIAKHLDRRAYRVFLFGSRASEKGGDRSDFDIGIEGPAPVPDRAWSEIKEEVEELPTLYTVDLVDFRRVSEDFRNIALEHVQELR